MNIFRRIGKTATSPTALVVYGLMALGVGAYETIKASREIDKVLDECKKDIEEVDSMVKADSASEDKRSIASKQDIYIETGKKIVKLYAPAVIFDAAGVWFILKSHHMLRSENMDLKTTVGAIAGGYSALRNRLNETLGDDTGNKVANGIQPKAVDVEKEDGKKEKTVVNVINQNDISPYAKFFDETSMFFKGVPEADLEFLIAVNNDANRKLEKKGYLFLNEVYAMLGFEETAIGNYVGWINEKGAYKKVDFNIFDVTKEANRRFVNGLESVVLLDFNVDGAIIDYI